MLLEQLEFHHLPLKVKTEQRLRRGCQILVLVGHYPACFHWFSAPTHLGQWLNTSICFVEDD